MICSTCAAEADEIAGRRIAEPMSVGPLGLKHNCVTKGCTCQHRVGTKLAIKAPTIKEKGGSV